MGTLGSLAVSVIGDSRELDKTFEDVNKKMGTFAGNLQKTGDKLVGFGTKWSLAVTAPIMGLFAVMANQAMALEATEAKYNTVFQGMTDTVDQFIVDFKKLTPATTAEARGFYSSIQDLLVPMGFLREDATELTGEFMHLAGALTNFNSDTKTAADVTSAMQSAILGIYKPLAGLGIQIDQATVQQKALEMGLISAGEEMSNQVRTQAVLALAYEQSGDALAAYTEESLDTKTKLALLKVELLEQAETFGSILLPYIEKGIELVKQFTQWLENLTDGQRELIVMFMALAAAIGPVAIGLGMFLKAVGAILGVLTAKVLLIGLVIAAVVAIGIAIYKWVSENEEVKARVLAAWETIKEALSGVWEALQELAAVATEKILEFWAKHGEAIMAVLSIVWDQIVLVVETAINIVKGIIQFVIAVIQGDWAAAWEAIKGVGETVWNFIKNSAVNIFNLLKTALGGIWESIKNTVSNVWENIKTAVITKAQEVYTDAKAKLEELWKYIKGIPGNALKWGRDIIQGLWDGIKQKWEDLKQGIKDIAQDVKDFFNPWAKHSPSLIDNIKSGVAEIEKLYGGIRLPVAGLQAAAAPLAAMGTGGGGMQTITMNISYNVDSPATAEHANTDLLKRLQLRGRGGL